MKDRVLLDLNSREFQRQFFALEKEDAQRVLATLRKLHKMTWRQVYIDRGLNWETIFTRSGPHGARLYSLRLAKGFRAIAYRQKNWMRLISLHPDHDSAYR